MTWLYLGGFVVLVVWLVLLIAAIKAWRLSRGDQADVKRALWIAVVVVVIAGLGSSVFKLRFVRNESYTTTVAGKPPVTHTKTWKVDSRWLFIVPFAVGLVALVKAARGKPRLQGSELDPQTPTKLPL